MLSFSVWLRNPQCVLRKALEWLALRGRKPGKHLLDLKALLVLLSPPFLSPPLPSPFFSFSLLSHPLEGRTNLPWSLLKCFPFPSCPAHYNLLPSPYSSKLMHGPMRVLPSEDKQVEEVKDCISFTFLSLKCMVHGRNSTRMNE